MNQSDFGQEIGVITTDISKIENSRNFFSSTTKKNAEFLKTDLDKLKMLYVADIIVE